MHTLFFLLAKQECNFERWLFGALKISNDERQAET